MLFEPCGELRKDYGAFCKTLRLTEREDVYSAILTREEMLRAMQIQRPASGEKDGGAAAASRPMSAASPRRSHMVASEVERKAEATAAAAAAIVPARPAEKKSMTSATTHGGKSTRASTTATQSGRKSGAGAAAADSGGEHRADEDDPAAARVTVPELTFVSLRHPMFCLNQRDMTPLSRAIPHCPSLVSIECVGCGLSQESYMLLVEAVYKSRNVVSFRVDFNSLTQPGFYADPTISALSLTWRRTTSQSSTPAALGLPAPQQQQQQEEQQQQQQPAGAETDGKADARAGSSAGNNNNNVGSSGSGSGRRRRGASMSGPAGGTGSLARQSSVTAEASPQLGSGDAAAAACDNDAGLEDDVAAGAEAEAEGFVIYLKPTEYCGLHLVPTALEEQLRDEKEKKGKVDPKKLQQLQSQQEMLQQFNHTHRIRLPRAWHGILLTGVMQLSLRGNGIGDAAVRSMVRLLQRLPNSRLVTLNLWGNDISDEGAMELARLLRSNRTLRVLDLGRNRIGDAGLLALIDTFRVVALPTMDDVAAYRYKYLTRPNATEEERQLAGQPVQGNIPCYQDLYNVWHAQRHPANGAATTTAAAVSPTAGAAAAGATSGGGGSNNNNNTATAQPSATVAEEKSTAARKRGSPNKAKVKNEPPPPTLTRPTAPFDKDCLRLSPAADSAILVPGNTVLEVLQLSENALITLQGAEEACRRLALREPSTDEEMVRLVAPTNGAAGHGTATPQSEAVSRAANGGEAATATTTAAGAAAVATTPPAASTTGKKRGNTLTSPAQSTTTPSGYHNNTPGTSSSTATSAFAAAAAAAAVVTPPEPHCVGLQLRTCIVCAHRYDDSQEEWHEMHRVQQRIHEALAQFGKQGEGEEEEAAAAQSAGVTTAANGNASTPESAASSPRK